MSPSTTHEPLETLPGGIPRAAEHERLLASPGHERIGRFAARFRERHLQRVAKDPFRQWSRGWEYPFAAAALQEGLAGTERPRLLEAGCGFTFFPYLLTELVPGIEITGVDAQPELAGAFAEARDEPGADAIAFRPGDLAALPDETGAFDAVACISVLEHVDEPAAVLREMRRVLKPGGLLVLTFDIAIDSDYAIPVDRAQEVLRELARLFPDTPVPGRDDLRAQLSGGPLLTTRRIAARDRASMPWASPLMSTLGSLRHGYLPRSLGYRNLTVWCGALR